MKKVRITALAMVVLISLVLGGTALLADPPDDRPVELRLNNDARHPAECPDLPSGGIIIHDLLYVCDFVGQDFTGACIYDCTLVQPT